MTERSALSAAVVMGRDTLTAAAVRAGGLGMGAAPEEHRVTNPEVAAQGSRPLQPQGQRTPPARTTADPFYDTLGAIMALGFAAAIAIYERSAPMPGTPLCGVCEYGSCSRPSRADSPYCVGHQRRSGR